jgi:hypothetical protein
MKRLKYNHQHDGHKDRHKEASQNFIEQKADEQRNGYQHGKREDP